MQKKILIVTTVLFFAVVCFFTIFARRIKEAGLPHVYAEALRLRTFTIENTEPGHVGERFRQKCYAVPEKLAKKKEFYILVQGEKNGEEVLFVKKIVFTPGSMEKGAYPVLSGDYNGEPVVMKSDRRLRDGEEVVVVGTT